MEELNLGKKLQAIRTSKKISVRKLAAMTNLTASMISQIENGSIPLFSTKKTLHSLCGVFLFAPLLVLPDAVDAVK